MNTTDHVSAEGEILELGSRNNRLGKNRPQRRPVCSYQSAALVERHV